MCKTISHVFIWDHGHIFDTERLEYMLLQICVKTKFGNAFDCYSGPVDARLKGGIMLVTIVYQLNKSSRFSTRKKNGRRNLHRIPILLQAEIAKEER